MDSDAVFLDQLEGMLSELASDADREWMIIAPFRQQVVAAADKMIRRRQAHAFPFWG